MLLLNAVTESPEPIAQNPKFYKLYGINIINPFEFINPINLYCINIINPIDLYGINIINPINPIDLYGINPINIINPRTLNPKP
jgi:hypothetical protein